jgi:large subunit ribosomal protein L15e
MEMEPKGKAETDRKNEKVENEKEEEPKAAEASTIITDEEGKEPKKKKRKSMYHYIGEAWNNPEDFRMESLNRNRLINWRRGASFVRVERPTRLDRARTLGYRAKQGFVVVRARVRRGGLRKRMIKGGRRPKAKGVKKITMAKNIQRIAEERTSKRYPNLQVINSYWIGQDGRFKYYEVLLADPHHPSIKNDPKINWICSKKHKGRAYRGLTSAGKKGRGLSRKGKGSEKVRPSIGSHSGKGK